MLLDVIMSRGDTWSYSSRIKTMGGEGRQNKQYNTHSLNLSLDIVELLNQLWNFECLNIWKNKIYVGYSVT